MDNQNTWTIVKFIMYNTVNVVPTCWIHDDDKCYWPRLPGDKITQAIKSVLLNTHWPSHKITIFRNATYDSYEVARKKARKAEDTSDLNTTEDDEFTLSDLKKRRRIIKHFSTSDEEENVYVKPPPKLNMTSCWIIRYIAGSSGVNKELMRTAHANLEGEYDNLDSPSSSNEALILRSQNSADKTLTPRSTTGSLTNDGKRDPCVGCCPEVKTFLKEILRQQHVIRTRLQDLETQIIDNKQNTSSTENHYGKSIFDDFDLPINTIENFTSFNDFIENEEIFSKSVIEMSKMGGNNSYDFVKRILSTMITNELANQYSWLGRRAKREFGKLPVAKLIIDAAEKAKKSEDKKQTETSISTWLRRANDRMKNRTI